MTTNTSPAALPADEQYALVHAAIQEIANRCDGAREKDFVGFDGTDTKYGRRIAGVTFETLTADDHVEIARIVLKYRNQALSYTGLDVATLPVVLDAQGAGTNYQSRDNARAYERRTRNAHLADKRLGVLLPDGNVLVSWEKGDPDFAAILDAVRALPDRRFDGASKGWVVKPSKALAEFVQAHDIPVSTEAAAAIKVAAERKVYNVGVVAGSQGKRLWIKAGYDANRVTDARQLPGRRWTGEMDEVDATPAVLAFAEKWGLEVSPKAQAAINDAGEDARDQEDAAKPALDRAGLMSLASRAGNANDLPAEFVALVTRAIG